jgi:sugar lactone lactonase YvrE
MRLAAIFLDLIVLIALSGCSTEEFVSTSTQSTSTTPGSPAVQGALHGTVHGGQSPVSGATIQLWAFGSGAYGGTSGALISGSALTTPGVAMTDANGNFNITGQYSCSGSTPVYITSTGGNPGLSGTGINNSALVLMSALINCGSLPGLTGPIVINEVTTVGSVYALAQFIGAGGSGGNIGAPNTGGGGAQTGLTNAFNEVTNMINIYTGTANTQTEFGTGYVPQAEIDTLANILVPCVNSASTVSTPSTACAALFAAAKPSGGTLPTTVLGAALDIALNPGNNVSGLFGLSSANAAFQPALTVAPNDWTIALAYDVASANHPQGLAIDGSGNVWITAWVSNNPASSEVAMISPIGVAPNNTYTSTTNLAGSAGLAVDLNGYVWIANSTGNSAVALDLTSNTIELKYGPYPAAAELSTPLQVVVDGGGDIWFTNSGNNTLTEIIPSPNFLTATYNFYSGGGLSTPNGIAFYRIPFGASSVWVANQGADSVTEFAPASGGATSGNNYAVGGVTNPVGAAIDGSGDVWVTNPSTNSVTELNSGGAAVSPTGWTGGGLDGPSGIALDGAGNLWIANTTNSSLTELRGSTGAALTPSTGYQSVSLQSPSQIAIDASGNVWAINTNEVTSLHGHETVTEFLGLATPVNMPLAYSLASGEIGQAPH